MRQTGIRGKAEVIREPRRTWRPAVRRVSGREAWGDWESAVDWFTMALHESPADRLL
ncbi:hypothetical protein ACGFNY_39375 [Streptomyces chartreusis]|uniref:hypothetical protein n=1 Tax=Streptomyces chartreusis TaxID=1969 RepID=UPI00371F508D